MDGALASGPVAICRRCPPDQTEVLRIGDASLPIRRAPHGTCAQLFHRRCSRPLHVDEWLQRAPSHGLGFLWAAGGERGHQEQRSSQGVDTGEYRGHEGADEAPWIRLRLVARGYDLPAGLLPLESVVLSQAL